VPPNGGSRQYEGGSVGELGLYHGTSVGEPRSSAAGSGQGAWLAWLEAWLEGVALHGKDGPDGGVGGDTAGAWTWAWE
jgi:hypothetical protein